MGFRIPSNEDNNDKKKDAKSSYEAKSKALQTSYILLMGFSLFFLFMILFPYISLKYSIGEQQSSAFEGNLTGIFSLANQYSNISDSLVEKIIKAKTSLEDYYLKYDNYLSDIETIESFKNKGNAIPNGVKIPSPLFEKCSGYSFGSKNWGDCNASKMAPNIAADARLVLIALHEEVGKSSDHSNSLKPRTSILVNNIMEDRIPLPSGFSQAYLNETKANIFQLNAQLINLQVNLETLSNYLSEKEENYWRFISDPIGPEAVGLNSNTEWLSQHISSVTETQLKISKEFESLGSRLEEIEAPIIGRVSFGLTNAISVFPFIVAIGFMACSVLLNQTMRSWKVFRDLEGRSFSQKVYPIWIDPRAPSKYIKLLLFSLCPIIIFTVATILNISVVNQVDNFPLFPFSNDFNKGILGTTVGISIIIFVGAILIVRKEIR